MGLGFLGPKRDEVPGDWTKLRNEELIDLYCSSNIVRVIKSRRMRWTGHVARMGFCYLGPERDEVTGDWRKLHNEELKDLYCSTNVAWVIKSRRIRWTGDVARMGEGRGIYRVLVGKPEGKRLLGKPRRRWEENVKMNLREVGSGCMD